VKWHLYIGEPADDKRCEFILIDFKSPIVSVNIGANAYLCLGNELPNDGELPPIHPTVQGFLDGSEKGAGVKSDDTNKANRMRTRALENFKADVSGGIMLGAAAWGMVDVDLGLFYGNMTAIGGFDLSLRHMTNMTCMNFDKDPGYHGWYGEGQIYAYLAAVMGLKLDLGFWEGEFPGLQPVRTPKGQRLYTERDMEILRKIRSLLHEQGMTIEGARRVLSGASPAVAHAAPAVASPVTASPNISAQNTAILQDALRELRELRALLTSNIAEEKRS
jgi:DNA-binding transcriptional MerR regulator